MVREKMRAGLSTACYYPELTERSLELAAAAGARCAEVFVNASQEFSEPFFKDLGRRAQSLGIDIVSIHPYTSGSEPILFFSEYLRRLEDGLELYRRFFSLAAGIGARYFIFHGAYPHMRLSDEQAYDRFALLAGAARDCGVTLLQENVVRCKSGQMDFIRGMRAYLGDTAQFVLDTKQARRAGYSAMEMRAAMGGGLRHIHISDYNSQQDCIPPGRGQFDFPDFFRELNGADYRGDLIIELYQDSYHHTDELAESLSYMEKILENF